MKMINLILILILTITAPLNDNEEKVVVRSETAQPIKKADFRIAYEHIKRWEGYYVNDPDDYGLETYVGITKRYNPNWIGWYKLDKVPNKRWNQQFPEVDHLVLDYYLTIWVREGFYKLEDQHIANYLFDLRIHLHTKQSIKLLNQAYGTSLQYSDDWIVPELDTINLSTLKRCRKGYYLALIKRKPHYKKFKKNWLRRADYV